MKLQLHLKINIKIIFSIPKYKYFFKNNSSDRL